MKKNLLKLVIGLMLVSMILSACGSSANSSGFPTGKFMNPKSEIGEGMEFNADGTWRAFNSSYTLARGTYSVEGDLYTEETNDATCPAPMKYKYSFDGTNLKFELTDQSKVDSCTDRKNGFDGVTYVLSK